MDMILKTVLAAVVLYYAALLCEYCYHEGIPFLLNRKRNGTGKETGTEEIVETACETLSVIGKSTYRKRQKNEPEDKQRTTENQADKTDNFANEMPEIGTETANTDVPDDDADYSDIDAEPDESERDANQPEAEYVPTPEELEEEEDLAEHYPDHAPDCATGYSFEDLRKLQRVLVKEEEPDEEEKQQARDVLPFLMGSDIYDKMLDEFDGARQRVALLMNNEV